MRYFSVVLLLVCGISISACGEHSRVIFKGAPGGAVDQSLVLPPGHDLRPPTKKSEASE